MTVQEIVNWCNEQIGQVHDPQRLGFFNLYYQFLTGRNPHADGLMMTSARNAWYANPTGFRKVPNDPFVIPQQGSIIFWDSTVAVLDEASPSNFTVWEDTLGVGVQYVTHAWADHQVLGWWSWEGLSEIRLGEPTLASDHSPVGLQPSKLGSSYRFAQGDTIWKIAPRFGLQVAELLEHNDIADWRTIQPGDVLRLPVSRPATADNTITIEVLPDHRPMHVNCPKGTHKVSFGYIKSFENLVPTGPLIPYNTKQTIVAIAHVFIQGEWRDFYMDALALGDYQVTKRVRYMIGFQTDDLDEGYVSKQLARAIIAWGL